MDLRFAEIRNMNQLCNHKQGKENAPLDVVIPYYQRPYKWDDQRISDLIMDFHSNEQKEYFAGSIVMVESKGGSFEVVDGQQRISTLFLMNYLKFILIRGYIEVFINKNKSTNILNLLNKMVETAINLFEDSMVETLKCIREDVKEYLERIDNADDSVQEDEIWDELLDYYQKSMGLPKKNFNDMGKYLNEYAARNKDFLSDVKLALKYSRNTYDRKLKDALSSIAIVMYESSNAQFKVTMTVKDKVIEQYINAMECIYETIEDYYASHTDTPVKYVEAMIEGMDCILKYINFCVVITGDENDAYTLFEVLNDRNCPIEDLDLIKNLFYKWYCNHNEEEKTVDEFIEKADKMWVEDIFSSTGKEQSKMISYLAAQYFTANSKLKYNDNQRYREILESDYLTLKNKYSGVDLINDISVYKMMALILMTFKFQYQKKAENVIRAERENSKSITYKALNLFHALNLYGVIPAITNIIVKKYLERYPVDKINPEIDTDNFKHYIEGIRDDSNNNNPEFIDIHKVGYDLWRVVLLAEDAEKPRDIAKDFIAKNYFNKSDCRLDLTSSDITQLNNQLKKWTDAWKYGNEKSQLKVKVLFINLFNSNRMNNTLIFNKTGTTFKSDKVQLDHLEAGKINSSAKEKYFRPVSDEDRENYTEHLGNFMIMDSVSNVDKTDMPLQDALVYYDSMANNHWLIEDIREVLNEKDCVRAANIDGNVYKVPKEEFFIRRKNRLYTYFKILLNKQFGENVVELPDLH